MNIPSHQPIFTYNLKLSNKLWTLKVVQITWYYKVIYSRISYFFKGMDTLNSRHNAMMMAIGLLEELPTEGE